jgi:predicted transglutaminase-like cysteine proteinase
MARTGKAIGAVMLGMLLALGALATAASATDSTHIAFVQTAEGTTSIPVGHSEFCRSHRNECGPNSQLIDAVPLDQSLWSQLLSVNATVNGTVAPVTDQDLYGVSEFWTYPNGYGDCEDYALAKRRLLLNAGWPSSTLLIGVVKQSNGEGHAVLMVRTDRGDFVLDNQVGSVDLWSDTPYKFVKRQSQADSGQWVDMIDTREGVTATAAIN